MLKHQTIVILLLKATTAKCSINLLVTFGQFKNWLISMQCQSFVFSALLSIVLVNYSAKISWKLSNSRRWTWDQHLQTKEFLGEGVINEFWWLTQSVLQQLIASLLTLFGLPDFIVILRKQWLISLMIMAIILLQDKHTHVPHTMRSKKQPKIHRSTC